MSPVFTASDTAIVTGLATCDFTVVHIDAGPAARRRNMASAAIVRGGGMVTRLAWRRGIIMAGHAGADHLIMVNILRRYRNPGRRTGLVTGRTVVGGINMSAAFAGGAITIMATDTGTKDLRMINRGRWHRRPGGRKFLMAGVTNIRRIDMTPALACRRRAIMALDTIIDKIRVINTRRQPGRRTVANITFTIGLDMTGGLAGGGNAVMTV